MGVNLGHLANALGIGGQQTPGLPQPNSNPSFTMSGQPQVQPGPHALLGATGELPAVASNPQAGYGAPAPGAGQNDDGPTQAPPVDAAPADIEVQGQAPQRMSPESMGMPGVSAMRSPSPESIADLRQQLNDKANMARELYHKGSEFGTHGILRDIIGNAEDFGRHLLGFAPRYNAEKWSERAYGMSADAGPQKQGESNEDYAARQQQAKQVADAATEQAMQYNPERTMPYKQQLVAQANTQASTEASAEYKNSQVQAKAANMLSGLGAQLYQANANAGPEEAQTNYARALPAIQSVLDRAYGQGVMKAPTQYDPNFVRQLAQAGFTGTNVQRAQANTLDNETRNAVARGRNLTSIQVARIGADARRYAADVGYRAAVNRAVISGGDTTTVEQETPTGSIVQPGKQTTRVVTHAPSSGGGARPAQPSHPVAGQDRKFFNGHWYVRGPNGEAVQVQ